MTTIISDRLTPKQLQWEVERYYQSFNGRTPAPRTQRHWRKILGLEPDETGHYWGSDLKRLKDAIQRLSQGVSLDEIAAFHEANPDLFFD